MQVEFELL